jgi:hypothetical protein
MSARDALGRFLSASSAASAGRDAGKSRNGHANGGAPSLADTEAALGAARARLEALDAEDRAARERLAELDETLAGIFDGTQLDADPQPLLEERQRLENNQADRARLRSLAVQGVRAAALRHGRAAFAPDLNALRDRAAKTGADLADALAVVSQHFEVLLEVGAEWRALNQRLRVFARSHGVAPELGGLARLTGLSDRLRQEVGRLVGTELRAQEAWQRSQAGPRGPNGLPAYPPPGAGLRRKPPKAKARPAPTLVRGRRP